LHSSFVLVKTTIHANKKAKGPLLEFIERSKMTEDVNNYVEPSNVRTTKYDVDQYGWKATCKCGLIHCINTVHQNGNALIPRDVVIQMDVNQNYSLKKNVFVGIN
jgi:hypothetical protein